VWVVLVFFLLTMVTSAPPPPPSWGRQTVGGVALSVARWHVEHL
jgi:hypothetical protein